MNIAIKKEDLEDLLDATDETFKYYLLPFDIDKCPYLREWYTANDMKQMGAPQVWFLGYFDKNREFCKHTPVYEDDVNVYIRVENRVGN